MKKFEGYAVVSVFCFLIGIVLAAWSFSIYVPSTYNTFLGIPYSVNEQYVGAVVQKLQMMMIAFVFLGVGLGLFIPVASIHELEKKIDRQNPPPPPAS